MKRIFLVLLLVLLVSPIASATLSFSDYADVKPVPEGKQYGSIDVYDGNILFPDEKVATYTLVDNTNICLTDCHASGTIELFKDGKLNNGIEFRYGEVTTSKTFVMSDYDTYEVEVNDYEDVCHTETQPITILEPSKTHEVEVCDKKLIGTHTETKQKEIEYIGQELPAGFYNWRIDGTKKAGHNVDWVITSILPDVKLEAWAWWTSVAPSYYYKFNQSLGSPIGAINMTEIVYGQNNMSIFGSTTLRLGKPNLGNMTSCTTDTICARVNNNTGFRLGSGNFTVALWYNSSSNPEDIILGLTGGGGGNWYFLSANTGRWYISGSFGDTIANIGDIHDGNWHHLVWVRRGSTTLAFLDGVNVKNGSDSNNYNNLTSPFTFRGGVGERHNYDDLSSFSNYAWTNAEVLTMYNSGNAKELDYTNNAPSVSIVYPTATNYYIPITSLNYTATDDAEIGSCWYTTDLGATNTSIACGTNITGLSASEGNNLWRVYANDTASQIGVGSVNFTLKPSSSITYPLNTTYSINVSALNYTASAPAGAITCQYSLDGGLTNTTITCGNNVTGLSSVEGSNTWRIYVTDSVGQINTTAITFYKDTSFPVLTITSPNGNTYDTRNVTLNYSIQDATLNSCWYSLNGGTNVTLSSCLNSSIILNAGNNSLIVYANDSLNNLGTSSFVYPYYLPVFGFCNATNNLAVLNFTFKNETVGQESVTASITSTWNYWLNNDITINRSYSFTNATENPSYSFCVPIGSNTLTIQPTIQYYNSYSPTRNYNPGTQSYNNITTNRTLFLLPLASGLYVAFQIQNSAGQKITGAIVSATKSGFSGLSESGITDASGLVTFFLDPTATYSIQASATGYDSVTESTNPTQSSYTIVLGGTQAVAGEIDYSKGVMWSIAPLNRQLTNDTTYAFNFTINSTYWTLEKFGINVTDINHNQVGYSESTVSPAGMVNVYVNTGSNSTFFMEAFWKINGTYVYVGSATYVVLDLEGEPFSIHKFFTDLTSYITDPNDTDGLFGIKSSGGYSVGLSLLIFLFIFVTTGIIAYSTGMQSPTVLIFIMTAMTWVFEVAFPLIDFSPNSTYPIATMFMAFVGIISLIWEVSR